jgi:parvulin-like peptidyl-prolyl isomerase
MYKQCFALVLTAVAVLGQAQPDPKTVVATVKGQPLTYEDVRRILLNAPPQLAAYFKIDPAGALMQYYVMQHLGREGERNKLDQQSPLKEQLDALRMNFLAEAELNRAANAFDVSPTDALKFYDEHNERYQRIHAGGILINFRPTTTGTSPADLAAAAQAALGGGALQRTEAQARALAEQSATRLRAGEDLAKVAAEVSEDPASKSKGGDLGMITYTSPLPTELRTAALAMAANSISSVIRAGSGFWVLKSQEKSVVTVDEASAEIGQELRKAHLDTFLRDLNTQFRPEIKDQALIRSAGQIQ